MPPEMKEVYSSAVRAIGYDTTTASIWVEWLRPSQGRALSIYGPDIPPQTAERVMNAPSINGALNAEIKPNFTHRYG